MGELIINHYFCGDLGFRNALIISIKGTYKVTEFRGLLQV